MSDDNGLRCPICDLTFSQCECPGCQKCGRQHRKECTIEHDLTNPHVIKGPLDLAGGCLWILETHLEFLMRLNLPAPMIAIGRTAIVYVAGYGESVGVEVSFPATRSEVNRAIESLERFSRDSKRGTSRLN